MKLIIYENYKKTFEKIKKTKKKYKNLKIIDFFIIVF